MKGTTSRDSISDLVPNELPEQYPHSLVEALSIDAYDHVDIWADSIAFLKVSHILETSLGHDISTDGRHL